MFRNRFYVLCNIVKDASLLEVELLLISDQDGDEPPFTFEEEAELGGWFQQVVQAEGKAKVIHAQAFTTRTISVYDFENRYELALGEFSLSLRKPAPDDAPTGVIVVPSGTPSPKPRRRAKRQAS